MWEVLNKLTAAVGIWRLSRSVLKTIQDLAFAHVTVSNQKELEQVVVALHRASLGAHDCSHQRAKDRRQLCVSLSDAKDGLCFLQSPCVWSIFK